MKLLQTNEDLGRRSLRRNKNLYLPIPKSNWLGRSFTYRAGQDWNQLPLKFRDADGRHLRGRLDNTIWTSMLF